MKKIPNNIPERFKWDKLITSKFQWWKSNILTQEYCIFIVTWCHQRKKRLEHETNKFQLLISWITHRHRLQTILYIHVTSMLISFMLTFHANCKNSWDCQRNAYKNALLDSRAYCYFNIYDFFFYNSSFMYICFVKYNASEVLVFIKKKNPFFIKMSHLFWIRFYRQILFVTFLGRRFSGRVVATAVVIKWPRTCWPYADVATFSSGPGPSSRFLPVPSLYFLADGSHVYCYNGA